MKIKAKNSNAVANSRLIVPCDGLITIDGNGCAEVSAACAEALIKGTNDWDYAEKTAEPKAEEAPAQEESEEEAVELNEREKFEKELAGMTVNQMKDLCREGGFDEAEWKNLKKATRVAYLLEKFDAASAQEESEEEEAESEQESAPDDTNATSASAEESEEEELEEEEEESEEEK